tara:strand:- start:1653 stop:2006 length:354 start_codon:yes stop_codon:yes gene_type:complete
MTRIVNKKRKNVHPIQPPVPTTQVTPNTNWIAHTKKFASDNDKSFGNSLSDFNNRCQYYDTMIDRNKYNKGPNVLQPDHPAMHPFIPNLSASDKKIKDEIYVQTKRAMCGKKSTFKK